MTDALGLPIALKLTPGQAHDGRSADDTPGTVGPGQTLLADAAYDSDRLRESRAQIGAKAVIRPIPRRRAPPPPDQDTHRRRNRIERFFSKLKHYRAIATRYEKHDTHFLALVKLAAVLLHEATDEVVEALVHHDVLEHRDHAFEGARIDLAAENVGRSSKDSA